ncbi:ABC transporter ATP-binding protein [Galbitalea sp. SE-J8]|uniref:ATP-binding cassette domain-containing protein n=1 Tax=Galbitalea sp. SE-J8 TaxID=3054952 RepID=UPI00259CA0FE|nr:ABC transporter ATP-binding protein [Galbitalea sp. SE-J8]MDM4762534.1 ABC transporter ATP-binding protein [Galbitalea sp. SE-J8]
MTTAIELDGVVKSFRGRTVIVDASAQFAAGAAHAVLGPNGSGKSVLLKIIVGFLRPDRGTVRHASGFSNPGDGFPADVGLTLDPPGYLGGLSASGNLERLAEIRRIAGPGDIRAALERFEIAHTGSQRVRSFSLGMKQRLALAQATFEGQRVLVLDEPFNGLDRSGQELARRALSELRDEGRTIVFTSHNPLDVEALADQVYEFDQGRLLAR